MSKFDQLLVQIQRNEFDDLSIRLRNRFHTLREKMDFDPFITTEEAEELPVLEATLVSEGYIQ